MESNPRPSDDTNMAELMRLRVQRSDIDVERSSASMWMCCKKEYVSRVFNSRTQPIRNLLRGYCSATVGEQRCRHIHCCRTVISMKLHN